MDIPKDWPYHYDSTPSGHSLPAEPWSMQEMLDEYNRMRPVYKAALALRDAIDADEHVEDATEALLGAVDMATYAGRR